MNNHTMALTILGLALAAGASLNAQASQTTFQVQFSVANAAGTTTTITPANPSSLAIQQVADAASGDATPDPSTFSLVISNIVPGDSLATTLQDAVRQGNSVSATVTFSVPQFSGTPVTSTLTLSGLRVTDSSPVTTSQDWSILAGFATTRLHFTYDACEVVAGSGAGPVSGAVAAPYQVTLAGPSSNSYNDVEAVSGPNIAALSQDNVNANPVTVKGSHTCSFMRLWDGTDTTLSTLAGTGLGAIAVGHSGTGGLISAGGGNSQESVTIQMQNPDGTFASKEVELGGVNPVRWNLFAENGAFSAESLTFTYDTRQVISGSGKAPIARTPTPRNE